MSNTFNDLHKIKVFEGDGNWSHDEYVSLEDLYQLFKERLINELKINGHANQGVVGGHLVDKIKEAAERVERNKKEREEQRKITASIYIDGVIPNE